MNRKASLRSYDDINNIKIKLNTGLDEIVVIVITTEYNNSS